MTAGMSSDSRVNSALIARSWGAISWTWRFTPESGRTAILRKRINAFSPITQTHEKVHKNACKSLQKRIEEIIC